MTILAFAQARELTGFSERTIECGPDATPRHVLESLQVPREVFRFRVALDCEYADWDQPVGKARELAVLPPVSGG